MNPAMNPAMDAAARADKELADRGLPSVLEELSRPVVRSVPQECIPHLALAAARSLADVDNARSEPEPLAPHSAQALLDAGATVLSTGAPALDVALGGGLPVGSGGIVEISGEAGVGKTQLALQLALIAAAPVASGGLASGAVYAVTEGAPPVRRMMSIDAALCRRFRLEPEALAARVIVETIDSVDGLLRWATHRLPYLLRTTGARVVIIDSVAAVYRPEFDDALSRANHLVLTAAALKRAAAGARGVCVCVNQVTMRFERTRLTQGRTAPALGAAWANCVNTRVFLQRSAAGREMRVLHSSYMQATRDEGVGFEVTGDGVVDA